MFGMGELLPLFPWAGMAFPCAGGTSDGAGAALGTAVFGRDHT